MRIYLNLIENANNNLKIQFNHKSLQLLNLKFKKPTIKIYYYIDDLFI